MILQEHWLVCAEVLHGCGFLRFALFIAITGRHLLVSFIKNWQNGTTMEELNSSALITEEG